MNHEVFFIVQILDPLLSLTVNLCSQRCRSQRLGLTSSEYRRSVRARKFRHFASNGAELIRGSVVRPPFQLEYLLAEDPLLPGLHKRLDFSELGVVIGVGRFDLFLDRTN